MALTEEETFDINDYLSAAEVGNIGFVKAWVGLGRDPEEQKIENGVTALMAALIHDQKAIVSFLLGPTVKSNVILCDNNGWTPLHYALLSAGRADYPAKYYVELLIQNASDVNARIGAEDPREDYRLQTPLHLAARARNFEICKILYEAGARFDFRDHRGRVPYDEDICGLDFRRKLVEDLELPALSRPVPSYIQQLPVGGGPVDHELMEILKQEPDGAKQKSRFFRNQLALAYHKIGEQRFLIESYQREDSKNEAKESRREKSGVVHLRKLLESKEKRIQDLNTELEASKDREEALYARLVLSRDESAHLIGKTQKLQREVHRLTPKKPQPRTQASRSAQKRFRDGDESLENVKSPKKPRRDAAALSIAEEEGEEAFDNLEKSLPTDGYEILPPPARKLYHSKVTKPVETRLPTKSARAVPREEPSDGRLKLTQLMATPNARSPQVTYSKRQRRTVAGATTPLAPSQTRVMDPVSEGDEMDLDLAPPPEVDGEDYHKAMRMLQEESEQAAPVQTEKRGFYKVPKRTQHKL